MFSEEQISQNSQTQAHTYLGSFEWLKILSLVPRRLLEDWELPAVTLDPQDLKALSSIRRISGMENDSSPPNGNVERLLDGESCSAG